LRSFVAERNVIVCSSRQIGKCLNSNTLLKIRCKTTGEIREITAKELFELGEYTNLSDTGKFTKSKRLLDYEILTDTGWEDLTHVHETVPYEVWKIQTKDFAIECADEHIVFNEDLQEVFVKDLKECDLILTELGPQAVTSIENTKSLNVMYDVTVDHPNHRFYSNGILSHNSTMLTVFSLWMVCFHDDYRAAIVANKETTAINIFKRIRLAYEQLPNYIKPGVKDYGKTGMTLGNDASIIVSTTTATSIRGDSLNCVAGKTEITLLTNKGALQTRLIEDLCVDDLVANTKELKILTKSGWSTFAGFKRTRTTKQLYTISTAHSTLTCTEDHLIFVDPLTTKRANQLSIGDLIFSKDGRVAIESITICGITNDWVYDVIETQDNSFWANGICVHNCVLLDEAAHIEQHLLEDFWSSVIPTISSGKKSKILVVSTPKGVGNKFYEIYSGAESGKLQKWKHERIDWWDVPGRDEEWKQEQIELLGSEEKFLQEYNNTFLDDAANAVGAQVLEKFKREKRPPIWTSEDGEYQVFDYPNPNRLYVIGVDVSEGIGRAASVAQILDVTDLQNITQVGVFGSARIEPYHFANKLNIIGNSWGKPPMLIERNNCGAQVIDALYHKHQYEKIVSYAKVSEQDRYNRTRSMGVFSHNNIRFDGIQNMRYWINHLDAVNINDSNTISEFETFVKFPNGVFRKKSDNFFDDRVMSLVWALFILESEICAQYFEIIDYDTQHKPLAIKDNGYWEKLPESYELKDLSIAPKVIAKPENYVAQSSPNFNSSELSILKIEEQFDEDVDSLLSQGYSFFVP
jgi:hypothetical protein